jgi:hypothetical protein
VSAVTTPVVARWREQLPAELFEQRVFLLWIRRPKPGKPGRFDKIPRYASGEQRHASLAAALTEAQRLRVAVPGAPFHVFEANLVASESEGTST